MDFVRLAFKELEKVTPGEWMNIPKPLTEAVVALKQCVVYQYQSTEQCSNSIADIELKLNKKLLEFKTLTNEFGEKIKAAEEIAKKTAKIVKARLPELEAAMENRIQDELRISSVAAEARFKDLKDLLGKCNEKIATLPTLPQIEEILAAKAEETSIKVKSDVRNLMINPEIEALKNALAIRREEADTKFQMVEQKMMEMEKSSLSHGKAAEKALKDFRKHCEINFESDNEKLTTLSARVAKVVQEITANAADQASKNTRFIKESEENTAGIKDAAQSIRNIEESIISLRQDFKTLVEAKAEYAEPNLRPASPLIPPPPIDTLTTSEIAMKIEQAQIEIRSFIAQEKAWILSKFASDLAAVEAAGKSSIEQETIATVQELKDKLSWLPINLGLLEGMSPQDARLFTLEARMRAEENSRIHAFNYLHSAIQPMGNMSMESPIPEENDVKPLLPVIDKSHLTRNVEKKTTPGGMCTSEWWKTNEIDRKQLSETESLHGIRIKFNSPLPEHEDSFEQLNKLKTRKKNRLFPHYINIDVNRLPRMQSAFASNTGVLKHHKVQN